ncbi:MAG: hypothetical protein GY729_19045, partial [Desulfobacteraceae bacterium]|nr:hypothetical protein [Desulfobacteraceae bacterium]
MIWILRNISVRLWVGVLLSIPASLYLMSNVNGLLLGMNPVALVLLTAAIFITSVSAIMDLLGKYRINRLIKEGAIWERSGAFHKAEQRYLEAQSVFDTFLLSPFWSRRVFKNLSGTMAKFNLTTSSKNPNFKMATIAYLKMNPTDLGVVEPWLQSLLQTKQVGASEQEVLTRLANIDHANDEIGCLLADIFLGLERKDFTAQKLYQSLLRDKAINWKYKDRITQVVGEKEKVEPEQKAFPKPVPKKKLDIKKLATAFWGKTVSFAKFAGLVTGAFLSFLVLSCARVVTLIKERKKL